MSQCSHCQPHSRDSLKQLGGLRGGYLQFGESNSLSGKAHLEFLDLECDLNPAKQLVLFKERDFVSKSSPVPCLIAGAGLLDVCASCQDLAKNPGPALPPPRPKPAPFRAEDSNERPRYQRALSSTSSNS
eukprot:145555-Amphidinium_carterae.1